MREYPKATAMACVQYMRVANLIQGTGMVHANDRIEALQCEAELRVCLSNFALLPADLSESNEGSQCARVLRPQNFT